ncbi:chromosome partitioning protein, ParB family [Parafrankia irregularis]|uniref:Chromosome partitioning protein, ParB family n=1 Tax=Parafrankia irregularis TaxID=795642 RepID=A0A0S4QZL2_9ACTN|nr:MULTISPECIES: ParB N-terminal domain-containing protein [Parafrankia]MBE3206687.1 ParB N-terminal domain-containing protein [Parafrankia sp. CH37]CUU61013.1 chromosome partitioning protein, ParB family [Parafrankia irregularis]
MTTPTPAAHVDLHVQHLDPRSLLLDRNLRSNADLDPDFLASIKACGVLIPIIAVGAPDGIRVRHGHRRTLAAVAAGQSSVPVIVIGPDSDSQTAEIERIVSQWHENEHRTGLHNRDKVAAVEQLTLLGLSATSISKKTRLPRAKVDAALTVARSELARLASEKYDFLDLTQAAVVAEFEDDEEAVKALVVAARAGGFEHVEQRCRDNRAEREERSRVSDLLSSQGTRVIDRPSHTDQAKRLSQLDHEDTPLTPDKHANCPGHAAYLIQVYERQPETQARDSDASPPAQLVYRPEYVCTDPDGNGHVDRHRFPAGSTTGTGESGGGLSEEEKTQRRWVVENNKAWRSATTVRRTWLRNFLTSRKTPPKGACRFAADSVASGSHELRRALERRHPIAREVLGGKDTPLSADQLTELIDAASEPRAQVLTLALILAAYEDALDVHVWRHPTSTARRYLTALQSWGYELAEVELLVTAPPGNSDDEPAAGDEAHTDSNQSPNGDPTATPGAQDPADDGAPRSDA